MMQLLKSMCTHASDRTVKSFFKDLGGLTTFGYGAQMFLQSAANLVPLAGALWGPLLAYTATSSLGSAGVAYFVRNQSLEEVKQAYKVSKKKAKEMTEAELKKKVEEEAKKVEEESKKNADGGEAAASADGEKKKSEQEGEKKPEGEAAEAKSENQ